MRNNTLIGTAGVMMAALAWSAPPAFSAQDSPFSGSWTSVDLDGSNQALDIRGSGGGSLSVDLSDDMASVACGGGPANFQGAGRVEGDDLFAVGTVTCQPGGNPVRGRIGLLFTYDADTDTLVDEAGVVWSRS